MTKLHVGICGGGMGGLAAAIAIARAGAKVTLLEAAKGLVRLGRGSRYSQTCQGFSSVGESTSSSARI